MVDKRTEFEFKRIECACSACLRKCYGLPGYLIPADLSRIADYLGEDDIVRFALDNLLASPGALVVAHGEIFAIPTIVPARRLDGACRFLMCLVGKDDGRWKEKMARSSLGISDLQSAPEIRVEGKCGAG
jgi:hypothetical protein